MRLIAYMPHHIRILLAMIRRTAVEFAVEFVSARYKNTREFVLEFVLEFALEFAPTPA